MKHPARGKHVLTNLVSGEAIEGVITRETSGWVLIQGARLYDKEFGTRGGNETPAPLGSVVVESRNIAWVQLRE